MELEKAEQIAAELLKQHGLTDWRFSFDRAKHRFGVCRYKSKQITVSRFLVELNHEAEFINTILHEIAHALVGPKNGHNSVWREKAIEIGCSGKRLGQGKTVAPKFKGVCPNCARASFKHRRSKVACGSCCTHYNNGRYSESFRLIWSEI